MEFEYRDNSQRRGKVLVAVGVILALAVGAVTFYMVYQARNEAQLSGVPTVSVVVARQQIPARKPIESGDVEVQNLPATSATDEGVFADPAAVLGLIPTVPILPGQPVYANLLASGSTSSGFSILAPGETIGPDSEAWRAIALTVPDDRAVGGLVNAGDVVDVFVTALIAVPEDLAAEGRYTTDRSTKITYQNVAVLQRAGTNYVLRVTLPIAEEISHLQASGTAAFTLTLRPTEDTRTVDVSGLGQTTSAIIERYGLPIPEVYPGRGPLPSQTPSPTPVPEPVTDPEITPSPVP